VNWSRPARGPFIPTPLVYQGILYVLANNSVLNAYEGRNRCLALGNFVKYAAAPNADS